MAAPAPCLLVSLLIAGPADVNHRRLAHDDRSRSDHTSRADRRVGHAAPFTAGSGRDPKAHGTGERPARRRRDRRGFATRDLRD
ncbi:hypothetical protein [Leptolyngbya sp. 7M]|uniref:hypothetical protein n=1 Tax=Leptolyngbya sp. 7M TaxID=2812896 RepID=UPI001B8B2C88|nr:hypothetical protein [Leptolyngbya sp. 7M]QYO64916.1 hypothetical protein JVX88_36185 [Leptolyngbya sp. 7M]